MEYEPLEAEIIMLEDLGFIFSSGQLPQNIDNGGTVTDNEFGQRAFTQGTCQKVSSNGDGTYSCRDFYYHLVEYPNQHSYNATFTCPDYC